MWRDSKGTRSKVNERIALLLAYLSTWSIVRKIRQFALNDWSKMLALVQRSVKIPTDKLKLKGLSASIIPIASSWLKIRKSLVLQHVGFDFSDHRGCVGFVRHGFLHPVFVERAQLSPRKR